MEGLRHQNQVLLMAQQEAIASQQASIEELHGKFDELLHVLKADQRAKLGLDMEQALLDKCAVQDAPRQPKFEEVEIPSPRQQWGTSSDTFFHVEVQPPSKSTWPLHLSGHQHGSVVVPMPVAQIPCSAEHVAWKAARGDTLGKTSLVIRPALRSPSPPGKSPRCAVARQSSQQRLDSRRVTLHCTPLAVTPVVTRGVSGFATAH